MKTCHTYRFNTPASALYQRYSSEDFIACRFTESGMQGFRLTRTDTGSQCCIRATLPVTEAAGAHSAWLARALGIDALILHYEIEWQTQDADHYLAHYIYKPDRLNVALKGNLLIQPSAHGGSQLTHQSRLETKMKGFLGRKVSDWVVGRVNREFSLDMAALKSAVEGA